MPPVDINYLAVVLSALAAQVLGFLWYGPLFGKKWAGLHGYTEEDTAGGPGAAYAVAMVSGFVISLVLAIVLDWAAADGVDEGIKVAVYVWVGFFATTMAMTRVFSNKQSLKLWKIEAGYYLVLLLAAGAILGAMQ